MYSFLTLNDNIPLPKPGAYLIVHIESGKKYVGISFNILSRLCDHFSLKGGCPKLKAAIEKYKPSSFIAIPLLYTFSKDRDYLIKTEEELIITYDSIKNGYNIVGREEPGKYSQEFSLRVKAAWSRPEVRAIHAVADINKNAGFFAIYNQSPQVRERQSRIQKQRYQSTENRYLTSIQVSQSLSSPQAKEKHSKTSRANRARSEVKAKYAALRGKRIIITDGMKEKSINRDLPIPTGWRKGRSLGFTRNIKNTWLTKDKDGSSIKLLTASEV